MASFFLKICTFFFIHCKTTKLLSLANYYAYRCRSGENISISKYSICMCWELTSKSMLPLNRDLQKFLYCVWQIHAKVNKIVYSKLRLSFFLKIHVYYAMVSKLKIMNKIDLILIIYARRNNCKGITYRICSFSLYFFLLCSSCKER